MGLCEVLLLRLCEFPRYSNGGELVSPDPAEQDLLFSRVGIVEPCTLPVRQRNRKGPILSADVKQRTIRLLDETVHLLIFLNESLTSSPVFNGIARRNDLPSRRPEDF